MKKLFALFLSVIVCLNVFSGMAFAAPVANSDSETALDLPEFTGTPDLIQKTIRDLVAAGEVITEVAKPSAALISSVEASSGLSFDTVKSAVADALTENRESGKIDMSRFNLNKSDAAELMDWVLKDYFLVQAVTDIKYVTDASGVTLEVRYSMSDGMNAALDEMQDEKEYFEDNYDIDEAEDVVADEIVIENIEKKDYLAALDAQENNGGTSTQAEGDSADSTCVLHTVPYVVVDPTTGQMAAAVNATWEMKKEMGELAPDFSNAEMVFDPVTGDVSVSAPIVLSFVCTKVEFQCAKCGAPVSYTYDESLGANNMITNAGEQTIYFDMRTGAAVTEKPDGIENVDWVNYTNYAIAVFPDDNTDLSDPLMAQQTMVTLMHDAGQARVEYYYSQMSLFNALNADVFGVSSPYWTSKNTQNNPMAAVKVLCNMDANTEVPPNSMLLMVQMLPQAFMSYVMQYKTQLLAMKDLAMEKLSMLPSNATDVQKMLVLHDWLAEHATFDMGSMTNVAGSGGNNDPMQMTTFGAVLSMQLDNYYGGVCLAYAAAYNWLIQWAFPEYYQSNGEFLSPDKATHITDFVQIRFFADTSETSVAGAGFGGGYFNNVHYFNAVQAPSQSGWNTKDWFYVDVCYDDISVECISQYRVEAEGNVSHMNFLTSPQTIASLYKSSTDYIDSLYDGYDYVLTDTPYTDDDGNIVYNSDGSIHYIYEKVRNTSETEYNNASYEDTWFSGAISPISFDGTNWYYVDSGNTYVAYKDYMDENGDFNIGNMGNGMGGDYNIEDILHDNRVDPANGDKLKVRAMSAPDYYNSNNGGMGGGMGGMGQNTAKTDPYAEVLIKYGYGHVATNVPELITKANDQRVDAVYENQSEGDANNNHAGMTGMLLEECNKDFAMNELYPGLVHTVALNDNVLYFNLANTIYTLDLSTGAVDQLKEYNDVYAATDGRVFTGASYYSVPAGSDGIVKQVKNHPIASFAIRDNVTFTPIVSSYEGQVFVSGYITETTPTMVCSIATNYAFSYPTVNGDSSKFESYTKEAGNYNPDYQRGVSDDSSNDNCEFLWCANIREEMPLGDMLAEYNILKSENAAENEAVVKVSVDKWCDEAAFTELRTVKYGLSDGSSREYAGSSAVHHYERNEDNVYVCRHCMAVSQNAQTSGLGNNYKSQFVWGTDATDNPVCTSATVSCYYDGCTASDAVTNFSGNQITTTAGTNRYVASVSLSNGATVTGYKVINPGDVDADDKITAVDIAALSEYLKNPASSTYNSTLADIDANGKIDDVDLSVLREILADASTTTSSGVNSATLSLRVDSDTIEIDSEGVATFNVYVEITPDNWNRGVSIMDASLTYDSSMLKLKSVSEGSLMRVTNNTSDALMFETEDLYQSVNSSGVLATLVFEFTGVIEEDTNLELSIKADSAARYNSQNSRYENVAVAGGNASVTVKPYCPHTEVTVLNKLDATCTDNGYTGDVQCNACGAITENGEAIPANGHTMQTVSDPVAATCTEAGYTGDQTCSVCGHEEKGSVIDALGHTEEIIPGKPATCTETGISDGKKCTVCEETLVEQVETAANGHTEVIDEAVAATCTQAGFTEGKHCSVCKVVTVAQEKVNALGHDIIVDAYVAPTCTEDGFEQGEHCTRCNEVTVGQKVIPALGHDIKVDAYVAPTCTTTGLTAGEHCSRCDAKTIKQEVIPELGHQIVIKDAVAATCTTTGLTEGKYCSVCNEDILQQTVVESLGHDMKTIDAVSATCTESGLTAGEYCSRCDEATVEQNVIPALGHDMKIDEAVAATCTESGLTAGTHCSRCDAVTVKQKEVPMLGHDAVTDKAVSATCTTTGLTEGKHCSRCGATIIAQKTVAALGHNEVKVAGKAATCTKTGLTDGKKCTVCGVTTVAQQTIAKKAHTEVTVKGKAATCTATGLTNGKKCSVCGVTTVAQQTIAKKAHTEVTVKGKAATCTKTGLTDGKKCSVCNVVTVEQKTVSVTGHKFGKWTQVKAPTLTTVGLEVRTCSACNEKQSRDIDKLDYIVGDIDCNGKVNAADARIALRISAKLDSFNNYNVPFAVIDVNNDGKIAAIDARTILRMAANLEK